MMGVPMVMSIASGRLTGRLGARTLATAGLSISAVGYLAMWPAIAVHSNALLAIPMLLAGSGIALTIPTITDAALAAVSAAQSGVTSGLLNTARQVGGVLGVALFGFFVRAADSATFVHGMARALIVSVLLLVAGAVMAWRNLGQAGARGIRARGASPQRQ